MAEMVQETELERFTKSYYLLGDRVVFKDDENLSGLIAGVGNKVIYFKGIYNNDLFLITFDEYFTKWANVSLTKRKIEMWKKFKNDLDKV